MNIHKPQTLRRFLYAYPINSSQVKRSRTVVVELTLSLSVSDNVNANGNGPLPLALALSLSVGEYQQASETEIGPFHAS